MLSALRYGMLALPLAAIGLPLYVHMPAFAAQAYGLPLATIGALLLLVRLVDAVVDPWIGQWLDAHPQRAARAQRVGAVGIVLGMVGVFAPPLAEAVRIPASAWLLGCLGVLSVGYSLVAVPYYTLPARLNLASVQHNRFSAAREMALLVGVLLASAVPQALGGEAGFQWLQGWVVALLIAGLWMQRGQGGATAASATTVHENQRGAWRALWHVPLYRSVLGVCVVGGLAHAITGTLFVMFVQDYLQAPSHAGYLLAVYFLAGAGAMPLWNMLGARIGKPRAWVASMLLAIACFAGTLALGAGDVGWFYVVCVLSGLAVGADLVFPPAMVAQLVQPYPQVAAFGTAIWQAQGKLTLALAAGIALPLLALAGYAPGQASTAVPLLGMYALLPCLCKALAMVWMWRLQRGPNAAKVLW